MLGLLFVEETGQSDNVGVNLFRLALGHDGGIVDRFSVSVFCERGRMQVEEQEENEGCGMKSIEFWDGRWGIGSFNQGPMMRFYGKAKLSRILGIQNPKIVGAVGGWRGRGRRRGG